MKNNSQKRSDNPPARGKKIKYPFFARLFLSTLLLAILQFGTFLGTLFVSGEFSYIKKYAYDSMSEKAENRKNYVENTLADKMPIVYEAGKDINKITQNILKTSGKDYDALSTDKALSKQVLNDSTNVLITMLRRGLVNDAYMVLDTGDLFDSSESENLATVYIRDVNISNTSEADSENLFLEAGSADISKNYDVMLDSAWTSYLQPKGNSDGSFDFYYTTIQTARDNPGVSMENLGYWSGFSSISQTGRESMRYTIPLVADDGTVYGVVGIGLMEKTILSYIPGNDLPNERSCYVLGVDRDNDDVYQPELHSGAIYKRLVSNGTVIGHHDSLGKNVYDFNSNSDVTVPTVGIIKDINIYNADSPYKYNKWAIILISEKSSTLSIYNTLVQMFVMAFLISAVITIISTIIMNRHVTKPVTQISKTLEKNKNSSDIIDFKSSGIIEIDQLTDAIKQLQINVIEQSSRVSKIISMSISGIGAFMYDTEKNNVFISESLVSTLQCTTLPEKDCTISFEEFKAYMESIDRTNGINILSFFSMVCQEQSEEINTKQYHIMLDSGDERWYRLSLRRDKAKILGLVQDVTQSVLEMQKVKYERDYDVTTGLLNRRAYYKRVEKAFRQPEKLKTAAFIMFDIDNLKYVNDTYGHDFGDDYIKAAANVFKTFQYHGGVVARMSGDEFNVFLSGFDSKDDIRKVVAEIKEKLAASSCLLSDGTHYKVRASGGISFYPDDSTSYEMLVKFSDFAMYTIKHSTKGSIAEFDMSSYSKDSILITGVEEMNRIIDTESIRYAFHSIISVKTGDIYGYEALMRPQSMVFGAPLDFIRIAKSSAKLNEIERLTWKLSLKTFGQLVKSGQISKNAKIFINSISNCIIRDNDISEIVEGNKDILKNVVLEFLESEETNAEYVEAKKRCIRNWNAMTALDDFGSGYNSEYALITLQPDIIKIDRSIVSGCDKDEGKADIITKLVQIAASKNILVAAEGVETKGELRTVIKCGVDLLQGFYFGKPTFEPEKCSKAMKDEILSIAAEANKDK